MIIDWFTDDPYDPPTIYERTRGADGVLHERYIMKGDDDYVEPFFFTYISRYIWDAQSDCVLF